MYTLTYIIFDLALRIYESIFFYIIFFICIIKECIILYVAVKVIESLKVLMYLYFLRQKYEISMFKVYLST